MPRPLTTAGRAALTAGTVSVAYLLEITTDEGAMRINNRNSALSYDGSTWDAAPDEWRLPDGIPIPQALVPEPFEMEFDGGYETDTDKFIGLLLTRTWHQKPVRFFGLLLHTNTGAVVDKFYEWRGRLDQIRTQRMVGAPSTVFVTCESGVFRALERNYSTYSHADQTRRDASDTFFINTAAKQGQQFPFGRSWQEVPGYNHRSVGGGRVIRRGS